MSSAEASVGTRATDRSGTAAAVAFLLVGISGAATGWFGVQLYELHSNTTFTVADACKICGRVERVLRGRVEPMTSAG